MSRGVAYVLLLVHVNEGKAAVSRTRRSTRVAGAPRGMLDRGAAELRMRARERRVRCTHPIAGALVHVDVRCSSLGPTHSLEIRYAAWDRA